MTTNINYLLVLNEKKFNFTFNQDFYDNLTGELIFNNKGDHNIIDMLFENKDTLLESNSSPFFAFYNVITNIKDQAVDAGGLTKNVFYLVSDYLIKSEKYFEQDSVSKLYKIKHETNPSQEFESKLYFVGQLFGLAIKLNQIIDIDLEPFLLYRMILDNIDSLTSEQIQNIVKDYNSKLLSVQPYLCYNDILGPITNYCLYDEEGNEISLNEIKEETTKKIKLIEQSNKKLNEIFIDGFRSQIDVNLTGLNNLTLKLFSSLLCGISELSYNELIKHIVFVDFDSPEDIDSIKNLIKNNICLYSKSYIESLLLVITGTSKIPTTGYPINKSLTIQLSENVPSPYKAATCFNKLSINKNAFNSFISSIGTDRKKTDLYKGFEIDFLKAVANDFSVA
jgi:hypothetical protein